MIYNCDCLELLKTLPDNSIDLFLQDLPYGVTKNKWDKPLRLDLLWPEWLRVAKETTPFIFTSQQPYTTTLINSMPKLFRYSMVWFKTSPTGFLNAKRQPLRAHEDILIFYRRQPIYNPQKTAGHERKVSLARHQKNGKQSDNYGAYSSSSYDSTERYPTSVLRFSSDKQKEHLHPTQKPIGLLRHLIRSYTNEDAIVFDGVAGVGTTEIACIIENRNCICAEIDKKQFEKAMARREKYLSNKAA